MTGWWIWEALIFCQWLQIQHPTREGARDFDRYLQCHHHPEVDQYWVGLLTNLTCWNKRQMVWTAADPAYIACQLFRIQLRQLWKAQPTSEKIVDYRLLRRQLSWTKCRHQTQRMQHKLTSLNMTSVTVSMFQGVYVYVLVRREFSFQNHER